MSNTKRAELAKSLVGEIRQFIAGAILYNQMLTERLGIHTTDQQLMNFVELFGEARPADLARLSGLSTGGVTVALDRLEKAGFVHRERNPEDRRSVIIRMDPERQREVVALYQSTSETMGKIFSSYDEKELRLILDFFAKTNAARVASNRLNPGE
jgi:MarR family transcriptional regulator, organic hydroperoxide resistance regulator